MFLHKDHPGKKKEACFENVNNTKKSDSPSLEGLL